MESCPLCGLAIEDLDGHTRRVHGAGIDDIRSDLEAGLESIAGKMTRNAALYGAEIPTLKAANRMDNPEGHNRKGAMREGGYL